MFYPFHYRNLRARRYRHAPIVTCITTLHSEWRILRGGNGGENSKILKCARCSRYFAFVLNRASSSAVSFLLHSDFANLNSRISRLKSRQLRRNFHLFRHVFASFYSWMHFRSFMFVNGIFPCVSNKTILVMYLKNILKAEYIHMYILYTIKAEICILTSNFIVFI